MVLLYFQKLKFLYLHLLLSDKLIFQVVIFLLPQVNFFVLFLQRLLIVLLPLLLPSNHPNPNTDFVFFQE
ncbi:MAG: hypothetical protein CMF72_01605 [Mameliella sp.]|nr:hypothetical protein [Mameliella sp.]